MHSKMINKIWYLNNSTINLVDYFLFCDVNLLMSATIVYGVSTYRSLAYLPNLKDFATFKRASSMCSAVNKFSTLILCAPKKIKDHKTVGR